MLPRAVHRSHPMISASVSLPVSSSYTAWPTRRSPLSPIRQVSIKYVHSPAHPAACLCPIPMDRLLEQTSFASPAKQSHCRRRWRVSSTPIPPTAIPIQCEQHRIPATGPQDPRPLPNKSVEAVPPARASGTSTLGTVPELSCATQLSTGQLSASCSPWHTAGRPLFSSFQ